jgi:HK97 family phage major capsid protein
MEEMKELLKRISTMESQLVAAEKKSVEERDEMARIMAGGSHNSPIIGANSHEARAMSMFGCSHVKSLLEVNTAHAKYSWVPQEVKQSVISLKRAVDNARWSAQMFHGAPRDHIGQNPEQDRTANIKGMLDTYFAKNVLVPQLKAFGSGVAAGGLEWIQTITASNYIAEYETMRVVEDKFRDMPMPSSPWQLPVQDGSTIARKIAENTAITGVNFTTNKLTFTAKKLGEHYVLPEELTEDSAVAIFDIGRNEVVAAQSRACETAVLNGDDDGTHIDSDSQAGAADLAVKIWKGLRRSALANTANGGTTDFSNAAATEANLRVMRQRMGKFGNTPSELVFFVSSVGLQQMMALPSVITIDKYGQYATVMTGELGKYQGIPIVVSDYMRSDLNATGVYDGIVLTRTGILLVNTTRHFIGTRRPVQTKISEDLPNQDRWLISSYQRKDFQMFAQSATEVSISYGVNIAV